MYVMYMTEWYLLNYRQQLLMSGSDPRDELSLNCIGDQNGENPSTAVDDVMARR
jgi:hypothetical protein